MGQLEGLLGHVCADVVLIIVVSERTGFNRGTELLVNSSDKRIENYQQSNLFPVLP